MSTLKNEVLKELASKDQLQLLDSIDRLRRQGINKFVSLPQIIVCGDQSSGKSSVLEAISGVAFPVKSNLCTRFPTELVLRRTPHQSARITIVPHESNPETQRAALQNFREKLNGFDGLPDIIEKAKGVMGITPHGKSFSRDILRVEVTGPDRPHLTVVDLPGLIHTETKYQSSTDVAMIQEIVQHYMRQSRSVILSVISAKNDFANQIVLRMVREADPEGQRTLGIITKPDMLVPGSENELQYVDLARNQEIVLRLGWHVLRNRDSEREEGDQESRDAKETEFFDQGVWLDLPRSSVGVKTLRTRLSKLLLRQIATELPSLMTELAHKYFSCSEQLEALGEPRVTEHDQRLYLFQVGQEFSTLVKSSVDATYNHAFFEDAKTDKGYRQRIRAIVQNKNEDFATTITKRGHYREICTNQPDGMLEPTPGSPITINEKDFLEHIEKLMRRTRGRELPDTLSPMIVADLFLEQSRPWEAIARSHVEDAWKVAQDFLDLVIEYLADEPAYRALKQEIFDPAMKGILNEMNAKIKELLKPHQSGHPITYNHDFVTALRTARKDRMVQDPSKIIAEFFEVSSLNQFVTITGTYNLQALAQAISESTPLEMKHFAAKEALDCLNAYYKVALKRFIDDVATQVIEDKLVGALHTILTSVSVFQMTPEKVAQIAGEPEDSRQERETLTRQLEVLQNGIETCKRFVNLRIHGDSVYIAKERDGDEFDTDDDDESKVSNAFPEDEAEGDAPESGTPLFEDLQDVKDQLEFYHLFE
ncbi:P-loop containing nucleoside triphosphate hydrolase protein [Sordaria sp. MPI-SDFR-AT-0083]|nr:P-loop containing nucleoside triphosphate hydrolase protein [Sordaria sp. MPI-SDFR-AT-0083]